MRFRTSCHKIWLFGLGLATCQLAAAQSTDVRFALCSPQHATSLGGANRTIEWTIRFDVIGVQANYGVALIATDFVVEPNCPGAVTLAPGDSIPQELAGFSYPTGLSSVNESGNSAFLGTPRPIDNCHVSVYRVGGGQNTIGTAWDASYDPNQIAISVGKRDPNDPNDPNQWQVLASGSFELPTDVGLYQFNLQSHIANLLTTNAEPWGIASATTDVLLAKNGIHVLVCQGDLNGNGQVDSTDLAVVLSHIGTSSGATLADGDIDGDGDVDSTDLSIVLGQIGLDCCPQPNCI